MGNIGFKEILIILLIVLILFGAKKIPELAKGLGSGVKEFKKAVNENDPADAKTTSASDAEKQTGDEQSS